MESIMTETSDYGKVSRNEPCPCGSGKKFKRCHGVDAPPVLGAPKEGSIDPQWIAQFSQMMNQLPKGQVQRLQTLMQKAVTGEDITEEAQKLEGQLPMDFQKLLMDSPMADAFKEANEKSEPTPQEASKLKKFFSRFGGKKES